MHCLDEIGHVERGGEIDIDDDDALFPSPLLGSVETNLQTPFREQLPAQLLSGNAQYPFEQTKEDAHCILPVRLLQPPPSPIPDVIVFDK